MPIPTLLGRYAVQRRIGSGGFATVWLAYDDQLDSPVAVKVLADNWTEDAQVRRRFLEEGRYLRRVESPHVVSVYDAGVLDDDRPYLVMTYADQGNLADRLDHGEVPPEQGLEIVRQIASGLQALHDRDILHRDVKPANVLFRSVKAHPGQEPEIRAMLGDLGLGKALDVSSRLTMIAGTPSYVAPEQAAAEPLDARADQYSLAAVSYLLLAGRPPFDHTTLQAAAAPPPVPPMSTAARPIADAVEDVVRRGLAASPGDRFGSVTEFAAALAEALNEPGIASTAVRPRLPLNDQLTQPGVRPTQGVPDTAPAPVPMTAEAEPAGDTAVRRPRRLRGALLAAALVVVAAGAGAGTYAVTREGDPGPQDVTITDAQGQISVTVPASWDKYQSVDGWTPPIHQPNQPDSFPALSVGTMDVWNNAGMNAEGVFAAIIPGVQMPARMPGHPICTAAAPQTSTTQAGDQVVTQLYTACNGGVVVEQLTQLDADHQLWVQVRSRQVRAAYDVLRTVTTTGS